MSIVRKIPQLYAENFFKFPNLQPAITHVVQNGTHVIHILINSKN